MYSRLPWILFSHLPKQADYRYAQLCLAKGKFITLVTNIKKEKRFQVIDLNFDLMKLEK